MAPFRQSHVTSLQACPPNNQRNQDQGAQGEFVNREANFPQIRKEHVRCQEGFFPASYRITAVVISAEKKLSFPNKSRAKDT